MLEEEEVRMKRMKRWLAVVLVLMVLPAGALALTGWVEEGGVWKYFDKNGEMLTDQWIWAPPYGRLMWLDELGIAHYQKYNLAFAEASMTVRDAAKAITYVTGNGGEVYQNAGFVEAMQSANTQTTSPALDTMADVIAEGAAEGKSASDAVIELVGGQAGQTKGGTVSIIRMLTGNKGDSFDEYMAGPSGKALLEELKTALNDPAMRDDDMLGMMEGAWEDAWLQISGHVRNGEIAESIVDEAMRAMAARIAANAQID